MNIHEFNLIGQRMQQDASIPVELTAVFPPHIDGVLLRAMAPVELINVKSKTGENYTLIFFFKKLVTADYSLEAVEHTFNILILSCQDLFDTAKRDKQIVTEKETWIVDGEECTFGGDLFEFEAIEWRKHV